jgi:large subunit ribosomal protein L22
MAETKTQLKTATALLRHARIAPRKMRVVAHLIKNMDVRTAEAQLFTHERRAAHPLLKLLKSAIANAKSRNLDETKLFVKEIRVDGGAMLKRWMPRAQGRATPIQKKTSHVTLVLQEGEKSVQSAFVDEKDQETKAESKIEQKTQEKGFLKKTFRRKSV